MAFKFSFVLGFDPVLVWGVFDVFWGLRCVLVGFELVIVLEKCKLWFLGTSGRFRMLLGWIYDFWGISFSFGGNPLPFGALFTCFVVSVVFYLGSCLSSW